mgnify:CR=1 FL=1
MSSKEIMKNYKCQYSKQEPITIARTPLNLQYIEYLMPENYTDATAERVGGGGVPAQ